MSPELKYLALTAMLTASLWIPYIAAQVITNGFLAAQNYVDPTPRPVPLWGKRADRLYLNAVETFAPFAALVVLIQLAGKNDSMTAFWAMSYSGCGWFTPLSIWPPFRSSGRSFSCSPMCASSACSSN